MVIKSLPKIAVLASGRGSNFEAIAQAVRDGRLQAQIVCLLSDRPSIGALEIARRFGVSEVVKATEPEIIQALKDASAEWVVLAGFKKILSPLFIEAFKDPRGFSRIVNIHPSLLPAFPGLHSYKQAFNYGVKHTGVTVHFVDHGMDTGPVCAQQVFPITDCESAEEVEARGLHLEHELYPATLSWILKNDFAIVERGGRLHVQPR